MQLWVVNICSTDILKNHRQWYVAKIPDSDFCVGHWQRSALESADSPYCAVLSLNTTASFENFIRPSLVRINSSAKV